MPTGTARLTWGIVLAVVLGLWLVLRLGAILFVVLMRGFDAYLIGSLVGSGVAALLLVLVVRLLIMKGLEQRRAFAAAQAARYQPIPR